MSEILESQKRLTLFKATKNLFKFLR